ncbi:MAG TPA: tripartite tricarboxylate transporter substrate binding protein [Burkholderiales bacterium]|nr:tripartite tricarboxylate transporter substrate binding protein [Burkholderiales bacterium]
MNKLTGMLAAAIGVAGVLHVTLGRAQSAGDFPARPIRMIVPFPPGGSNDIMGRYFAQYLTERFGRQVVLDNRPGADGIIGTEIVARAAPDGYTLLVASAAHAVNGGTRKLPFDPVNSFAWAAMLGLGPSVLSVHASLPVNSVKELIAHGKANPGKLALSTSGGYAQFTAELFHHLSGMKLIVVVYKGGFPALLDAMAGQVQINIGALVQTIPHLKGGKIRALATTGAKRASPTPDLPTIAEAGVPGYEANNWWAVAAPAGTPAAIVNKLNAESLRFLKQPETLKRFEADGVEADPRTPDEVRKLLPVEMAKWANVAKVANIRNQ